MAGCNCNKETDLKAYQDLTETLKTQHFDWSSPQVRREAAKIFRPQYRQNADSRRQELSGAKEYDGTDFTYSAEGDIRFTYGDGSMGLLEFHERQLRLTPEAYSEAQHQTSLLIDQAFRSGATEVVTSYLEPSGQRDIVVMTLDRATGKGKMRIINTLNDHTMPEMRSLIKSNFSHLSEIRPTTKAFILSDKPVSREQIQQKFILLDRQIHAVLKETAGAVKNTVHEIQYTAVSVDKFIHRPVEKISEAHLHMIGESFIHHVRPMFEHKEDRKVEVLEAKKHQINLLDRSPEREEKNTQPIQIPLESDKKIKREKLKHQRSKKENTVVVHLRKYDVRRKEKTSIFRMNEGFNKLTRKDQPLFRRTEKEIHVKETKILRHKKQRNKQKKEILFQKLERKLFLRKERKSVQKKEKILWNTLKRLVQKAERQFIFRKIKQKEKLQKINTIKKENRIVVIRKEHQKKKQEKQYVIDFSVALVIWFLLRLPEKRPDIRVIKHEKQKKLIEKESFPWILFAIIWHLAMIRESGMTTQNKPKKVKKKHIHNYPLQLPPQGVIFAFAS